MDERMRQRTEEPATPRSAFFAGGTSPLITRAMERFRELDASIDRQLRQSGLRQQRYRRQQSGE